jgi:hypothetical protein
MQMAPQLLFLVFRELRKTEGAFRMRRLWMRIVLAGPEALDAQARLFDRVATHEDVRAVLLPLRAGGTHSVRFRRLTLFVEGPENDLHALRSGLLDEPAVRALQTGNHSDAELDWESPTPGVAFACPADSSFRARLKMALTYAPKVQLSWEDANDTDSTHNLVDVELRGAASDVDRIARELRAAGMPPPAHFSNCGSPAGAVRIHKFNASARSNGDRSLRPMSA